ncbi:MAG: ribonuclease Z [Halioglobus sp.]|jgi:ribonuclease Z
MKKVLIATAVIALLVYTQRATIATQVLSKGIEMAMSTDIVADLEDGLHLALCGAGGPLPDPKRSGACVLVIAGDKLFVVDAGTNGLRNINRMRYPTGRIEGVFLTHFHSDHIDGLGEMATIRWVSEGNTSPLPVYGPEGVAQVVKGFNTAYAQDAVYRNDHHGDAVAPPSGTGMVAHPFPLPASRELRTVFVDGDLTIQALAVDHEPVNPAVAYLFTYKGRTILVSGDTAKSDNIEMYAQDIDLLVHEALSPQLVGIMNAAATKTGNAGMAKITFDILDYHASPVEAAETARDAGVGHLLYYHIVPPLIFPGMEAAWLEGVDDVFSDYTMGRDGTTFSLPAGSKEIEITSKGF